MGGLSIELQLIIINSKPLLAIMVILADVDFPALSEGKTIN